MGFKEEIKVHLSTRSAECNAGRSKATWRIKDPVRPPNPLYKMKIQVSNAIIPNSFDKITESEKNNKLSFVYTTSSLAEDTLNELNFVADSTLHTITIPDQHNPTELSLYSNLYDAMKTYFSTSTGVANLRHKPIIRYDVNADYPTMTFEYADWQTDTDLTTPNPIEASGSFYLVTPALARKYRMNPDLCGLAPVLGFTDDDILETKILGHETTDNPYKKEFIYAESPPDLIGSQFIKIMTNLNVNNIDPNTLTFERILGVIPVTESETDSKVIYMAGGLQSPQYVTIGDPELKTIELELRNELGNLLNVYDHWYVELTVLFEEEEKTDIYRGMGHVSGPAASVNVFDPEGYARLHNEIRGNIGQMRNMETENRSDNFSSGTKRPFGM